jgi:hypothetical protein
MRTLLALVLGAGFLAACGGGGGSGATPAPAAPLLTINASNQNAVGSASMRGTSAMLGAGSGVNAGPASAPPAHAATLSFGSGAGSIRSVAAVIARALADSGTRRVALAAASGAPTARAMALQSFDLACSTGSVRVSAVDADNNSDLSVGDTMTLTFNQCGELEGTATGAISITMTSLSFVSNLLSFGGSMSIQQFAVTDGTHTATLNGAVAMSFAQTSATATLVTMNVAATGLNAVITGGSSDTISYDPGFAISVTSTLVNGIDNTSATISGGLSASSLGRRIMLETPVALQQLSTEDFPHTGTLRAVGNASALRMTALSASTVRIELDANLDGTYEASSDVAWTTLLPG